MGSPAPPSAGRPSGDICTAVAVTDPDLQEEEEKNKRQRTEKGRKKPSGLSGLSSFSSTPEPSASVKKQRQKQM